MSIISNLINGYKKDLKEIKQKIEDLDTELFRNHVKQLHELNDAKNILEELIDDLIELKTDKY